MAKHPVDLLSERQWALLLETYADRQRLMVTNEDMGERRFQVLMTVVSAVGIALGLVANRFDVASLQATALLMALLLTALGYATTVRMAHRNVATSRLKAELLRSATSWRRAGPTSSPCSHTWTRGLRGCVPGRSTPLVGSST